MGESSYSTLDVRARAVRAALHGQARGEVARAFGVDRGTLYRWVTRYQHDKTHGLDRKVGSGRPRKLEELHEDDLRQIVLQPATTFDFETDLWTVARLHQVITERFQVAVSRDTIWRRLREAGLTCQKPEREYYEADEQARQKWRRYEAPKIRRAVKTYKAILYFQDESNISLTAFLGKTWAPRGKTPRAKVTGKRGGVAAMSALSRRGHLLFRLHQKRIASQEVIEFLRQMLKYHPKRHLVVVMDRAPPHVSKKTQAFIAGQKRLHVYNLPSYSPDWNPDEKVWNHLKHHELKSHQAKSKSELTTLARKKLRGMSNNPGLIRGLYFRSYVADFFG